MSQGRTGNKQPLRNRKIDVRRQLPVLRESDLGNREDVESAQLVPVAATGVEKEEEEEEHLQLALQTHYGSDAKAFIPIPEANKPFEEYTEFYQKPFVLPKTLIRFSAPIEEFIGCPYNMDGEDDSWLAEHNEKCDRSEVSKHARLTEDQFEELMWGLEKITQEKNWVDPWSNKFSPHLGEMATLEDLDTYLKTASALSPSARQIIKHPNLKAAAAAVFAHWAERRKQRDNRPIQPTIKTEDTGANDAYICFRRRENRPMRKTRRVDQQSMDKVRQLRQQMDQARNLLDLVTKRERYRKESLILEELIFQQKIIVRRMKKKLGVAVTEEPVGAKKPQIRQDRGGAMHPTKIFINVRAEPGYSNPLAQHEINFEHRKRKREEDERLGWIDLTENPYVAPPATHNGDRFFREDHTEFLSYPSPISEDGVVPASLLPTGDPAMDLDVPFLPDKEMEDGKRETILRSRFGRVRIGRGGRRIHDRRCSMADVFPEMGPQHAYLPGEVESRWKRGPDFELENDAKIRQEMQEKLSRFRWGDGDVEDLAIVAEGAGEPLYDNVSTLFQRYGLIGELDYKTLEVQPRIPAQAEPRISGPRSQQAIPAAPQAVIRPGPPSTQQVLQQQQPTSAQLQQQQLAQQQAAQQAAAALKKKAASGRVSTDNLQALAASGLASTPLALNKVPGKPGKGEEDPKAAAVKMLMREAAKGAQQIQQMSSQLQAQAQLRNQQALQGNFQASPALQQSIPLLANQLAGQNAAQFGTGAGNLTSPTLGSPVMGNGGALQAPGSPALNGQVTSPTKLAPQGMKAILAAGGLGALPSANASPVGTSAALQQQAQRVQLMRNRQAAAGGAQLPGGLSQTPGGQNPLLLQQQLAGLANQIRSGQIKIQSPGNVPVVLNPNNSVAFAANGLGGSPPRQGANPQQVLAQIQQRMALAGNANQAAVLQNIAQSGLLNGAQLGDLGGDDDGDGK